MASSDQLQWLRDDLGITLEEAEALFLRAEASSSIYALQEPLTKIYYYSSLLNDSAKLVDYRKNHTDIKASDIFKHIKMLLERAEAKYAEAVQVEDSSQSIVRSGRPINKPVRETEYPNGWRR